MEKHWKRICNPTAKQVERKTSVASTTGLDLLNRALVNTESDDQSSMAVKFDKICKLFFIPVFSEMFFIRHVVTIGETKTSVRNVLVVIFAVKKVLNIYLFCCFVLAQQKVTVYLNYNKLRRTFYTSPTCEN